MSNKQADNETTPSLQGRAGGGSPFLYHVAKDLIERFGNNLSNVVIVFPGKRAQLYMNSFLSHIAQGPVWAPQFITIDELFQKFSDLTPSDNILNVCTLYRIYAQLVPNPESLDEFYGWGEILMNDFDDIDKHLVDANKLFGNAADLAAMEQVDFLNDKQLEALRQFFTNFDPKHQTEIKRRFMEMWQIMPEMYRQLKEELHKENMMYRGAIYRDVASRIKNEKIILRNKVYCFVGFNVLDEVEEALFSALHEAGKALFYWDYDVFYAAKGSDHEAGLFLRHNLKKYPNALAENLFDNLISDEKRIRIIATSTDNAQARYLPQWLAEGGEENDSHTAIVLCDEALMRPTLHAIPNETNVNITMGYPIMDTAIQGYLTALIDLQVDGYDESLRRFLPTALERVEKNPFFKTFPQEHLPLQHPTDNLALIDWLTDAMEALGKSLKNEEGQFASLYMETTFQIYCILGKFRWLTEKGTLDVKPNTLRRLIRQVMATASVPFHGEMDMGVQVMGLLEARNLDFRRLIMLSVNEGIIPRRYSDTSLIPYILRTHFGLDTTERQDAVYAYSFYRLLQRAQDITLMYNSNTSGATQREQSRFLRQLAIETSLPVEQLTDTQPTIQQSRMPIVVEKDKDIMDILANKKYLSPTAINQYITCPLRFYYQQVAHLRMPERPQDGIDNPRFGTIFHDICEIFYNHLCRLNGRKEVLRSDLSDYNLQPYINLVFWVDFFHGEEYDSLSHETERKAFLAPFEESKSREELEQMVDALYVGGTELYFTGVNMIIRDVIQHLVTQLLQWDMEHTPFTLYDTETEVSTTLTVPSGERQLNVSIGGRIDRIDIMFSNGRPTLRIVDYKTGKAKSGPKDIEGIFTAETGNAHGYYLQTMLYALIMSQRQQCDLSIPSIPIAPVLFYVLSATDARNYNPCLKLGKDYIEDITDFADDFQAGLRQVLCQIYNPSLPFVQTSDEEKHCKYCDFRRLCGR